MTIIKSYLFNLITPKFFIGFGIVIFICILFNMFFTQKLPDFRQKFKSRFYTYVFSFAFIFALVALLGYNKLLNNNVLDEFVFYQICSLVLGIVHVFLYRSYLEKFNSKKIWHELFFTLLTVFYSIVPFFLVYTLLNGSDFMFLMLGHFIMFFIPTFINVTFNEAMGIPAKIFKLWQFPDNYRELFGVSDEEMRDLIVITFLITKDNQSYKYSNFRAKGPVRIDFGRLFHNFIQDYNNRHTEDPICIENKDGELEKWIFFLRPRWFESTKYIDPDLALYMNGIEENSVIVCQRINQVTLDQPSQAATEEPLYEYNN